MKLLDVENCVAVSGGTAITIAGRTLHVNTDGIPKKCVKGVEKMVNVMMTEYESNQSLGQVMGALGDHYDVLSAIGCQSYINPLLERMTAAAQANWS